MTNCYIYLDHSLCQSGLQHILCICQYQKLEQNEWCIHGIYPHQIHVYRKGRSHCPGHRCCFYVQSHHNCNLIMVKKILSTKQKTNCYIYLDHSLHHSSLQHIVCICHRQKPEQNEWRILGIYPHQIQVYRKGIFHSPWCRCCSPFQSHHNHNLSRVNKVYQLNSTNRSNVECMNVLNMQASCSCIT